MPTKLYVGNLAYAVTQEDLAELFGQAGKVESAVVVTDKFSGQSRGFGFVEMVEAADAATAIQTLNDTDLKGRRIKIDEARAPVLAAAEVAEVVVEIAVAAAEQAAEAATAGKLRERIASP